MSVNRPRDAVEIDTTVTKDGGVSIADSSHLIGFAWARRRVHPATRRAPGPVGKTRYVSASVRNLSAKSAGGTVFSEREHQTRRHRSRRSPSEIWCLRSMCLTRTYIR